MRRLLLLVLLVGAVLLVVLGLATQIRPAKAGDAWTTDSPRAREALELGLDALRKRYMADAMGHFERALELDPDFAMARLYHDWLSPDVDEATKRGNLLALDYETLSAREQVLVRSWRAHFDDEPETALTSLERYLERHPDDPYIRYFLCNDHWNRSDFEEAERCYEDLIDRHPSWADAQNRLGYLAIADGRFQAADERFEAYRFIAPDQANPYDSLAELAMIRGRFHEASDYLHQALEIKPDFCESLLRQVQLAALEGNFDEARVQLSAMEEESACAVALAQRGRCLPTMRIHYLERNYEAAWTAGEGCEENLPWYALAHRSALVTGRMAEADALLGRLREIVGKSMPPAMHMATEGLIHNYTGSQLFARGDYAAAAEQFAAADERSRYWSTSQVWVFKFYNQVDWLVALERAGDAVRAEEVESSLMVVNPAIIDIYRPGIEALAPERR